MKLWIVTSRAFRDGEYFDDLETTYAYKTEEEAKERYYKECGEQTDWFWNGMDENPYDHYNLGKDTYVLTSDEAMCVVTLREVELDI